MLRAVVIADITGSTRLYEKQGNARAVEAIERCLGFVREAVDSAGGRFVASQGDDVLAVFESAEAAFGALRRILEGPPRGGLLVHAGLHWGEVLERDGNLFGDAINTAARLASLAKPGELLVGDACRDELAPQSRLHLQPIGSLRLRGREAPTEVHAFLPGDGLLRTEAAAVPAAGRTDRVRRVRLVHAGGEVSIREGGRLVIGRARGCDVVVGAAWVSRSHATVSIRQGLAEYSDHSSTGSHLLAADGTPQSISRQTVALSGRGTILLGFPEERADCPPIRFEVDHVPDDRTRSVEDPA